MLNQNQNHLIQKKAPKNPRDNHLLPQTAAVARMNTGSVGSIKKNTSEKKLKSQTQASSSENCFHQNVNV